MAECRARSSAKSFFIFDPCHSVRSVLSVCSGSPGGRMAFEFKLPDLGEGVSEGEIVRWLVNVGDAVRPEQELVEVMTDKVTAALPSPLAGRVSALHGVPGEIVP